MQNFLKVRGYCVPKIVHYYKFFFFLESCKYAWVFQSGWFLAVFMLNVKWHFKSRMVRIIFSKKREVPKLSIFKSWGLICFSTNVVDYYYWSSRRFLDKCKITVSFFKKVHLFKCELLLLTQFFTNHSFLNGLKTLMMMMMMMTICFSLRLEWNMRPSYWLVPLYETGMETPQPWIRDLNWYHNSDYA